jgi:hypothetical protein
VIAGVRGILAELRLSVPLAIVIPQQAEAAATTVQVSSQPIHRQLLVLYARRSPSPTRSDISQFELPNAGHTDVQSATARAQSRKIGMETMCLNGVSFSRDAIAARYELQNRHLLPAALLDRPGDSAFHHSAGGDADIG